MVCLQNHKYPSCCYTAAWLSELLTKFTPPKQGPGLAKWHPWQMSLLTRIHTKLLSIINEEKLFAPGALALKCALVHMDFSDFKFLADHVPNVAAVREGTIKAAARDFKCASWYLKMYYWK